MHLRRKEKGKFKVLSGGFCLRYLEAEQRALEFLHICYSNVNGYSSALGSNKQNPPERTTNLSLCFRNEHTASLKNLPSPAPSDSLPYWFQGIFAAMFVLNYWLGELLFSVFANRFELRCEPKQLTLLYYKTCPCFLAQNPKSLVFCCINGYSRISFLFKADVKFCTTNHLTDRHNR